MYIFFMTKTPDKKLDVKLIALDLDDTLLNNAGVIGDKNVEVLRRCADAGIYVVLCSGRLEAGIAPHVHRLEIAGKETGRYIVAINGCSIFDMHKRVQLMCNKVEPEILLRANEIAEEAGLRTQIYSTDTIYYGEMNPWIQMDIDLCKVHGEKAKDFKAMLSQGSPKMLIPCNPKTPEIAQTLLKKLKDEFGEKAVVFTSKPYFLEVLPPNCGKGEALLWLANHIGIKAENMIGFGDGMNDESMISKCGYGVAMKNGCEYIRNIADFITEKTNDEDGVGDFLEKYVL